MKVVMKPEAISSCGACPHMKTTFINSPVGEYLGREYSCNKLKITLLTQQKDDVRNIDSGNIYDFLKIPHECPLPDEDSTEERDRQKAAIQGAFDSKIGEV